MSDIRGYLLEKFRKFFKVPKLIHYGLLNTISAIAKGVILGRGCKFYGRTKFIRRYKSSIHIGNNVQFRASLSSNQFGIFKNISICTLKPNAIIIVGNNCGLSGCSISSATKVEIENNVLIGANVIISDYDWHGLVQRDIAETKPVHIKENVWLGANSIVLKGVTIGENSTIGAGSIVTKDIPANCIAAGNPCRVIRYLKDES